jgi:negative regulator of sigma E activity
MSTPSTEQTAAVEPEPTTETTPTMSTSEGTLANVEAPESEPGFIARHTTTLITLMVAVIVAAVAIAGVVLYKNKVDGDNADTAAAFTTYIKGQGASVDSVECQGGTCAAIIQGQAYTVLVQKDANGKQHFGVSAYAGK